MNVRNVMPLNRKVTASKTLTRSVSMRPIAKHKKVLTTGTQIKTHLRCDHLEQKPVWGAGNANVAEEDNSIRRENYRKRCIDRKIDEICDRAAKKGGWEDPSQGMAVPDKHVKVRTQGEQIKTHLRCNHGLKSNLQSQEQQNQYNDSKRDGRAAEPSNQTRKSPRFQHLSDLVDQAGCHEPTKRRRMELKSNIRNQRTSSAPRTIYGTVDDDSSDEVSIIDVNVDSNEMTCFESPKHHSLFHSEPDSRQDSPVTRDCTRKSVHFPDEDFVECHYCEEYGVAPDFERHKVRSERNDKVYGFRDNKRRRYEYSDSVTDEPCPLCQKEKNEKELDVNNFCGDYRSMCQFCGKIFQVSDLGITCKSCQENRRGLESHSTCMKHLQHSHTGWDNSAGPVDAKQPKSAMSSRGRYSTAHSDHHQQRQSSIPRRAAVNNHVEPMTGKPQVKVGQATRRASSDLEHTCVHRFHQTPRLFVEPSFPDDHGRSTCLLCGAADDMEQEDRPFHIREMSNSAGSTLVRDRTTEDDAPRHNSIRGINMAGDLAAFKSYGNADFRLKQNAAGPSGSRRTAAAATTALTGKNCIGAAVGRDSNATGPRVTIRSRTYNRRGSNGRTRRISPTTTATAGDELLCEYAQDTRDGANHRRKRDHSTELETELGSEKKDRYRRRSNRLNPGSNTASNHAAKKSNVVTPIRGNIGVRMKTNQSGKAAFSTGDIDDLEYRDERRLGSTTGMLPNSGKPVDSVCSSSVVPRKRYVLSSVNTTGLDRASFVGNRSTNSSSNSTGRSSFKENNTLKLAATRVKRDPKNSMALADHL